MELEIKESKIKSFNPATGEILKEFNIMQAKEVEDIINKADKAFQTWKTTSFEKRSEILNKAAELIIERKDALAKLASQEMGKLKRESEAELEICSAIFKFYAKNGAEFLADEKIETEKGSAFISYEPLGVILSVQPWNFPFYQVVRSMAPTLMAGNTMVLKHASIVPQCAIEMEKLIKDAGAPEYVYNNLIIPGSATTELVSHDKIKGVTLTGSEPAGSSIAAAAGKYIKKSTLELGGSDPFIVLDDADIEKAAKAAVKGRMWNAGQVCTSPKRIIVHEKIFEQFKEKAKAIFDQLKVGDPLDSTTSLAPLSSEQALKDVVKQVQKAAEQGANIEAGGRKIDGKGNFMEPTLITGITPEMDAYHEEIFGPVFMLYSVKDESEAIELANATKFGLGGSIFSNNEERAVKVARQINSGMVYINHLTGISPELPFGGTKNSGYGRDQGKEGILEFVNKKLIRLSSPEYSY